MASPQKIILLGSTGSIGRQTLEVIKKYPAKFKIIGLACDQNIDLLERQIIDFKPAIIAVRHKQKAFQLSKKITQPVNSGLTGVCQLAKFPQADLVINAISGPAGLKPTLAAIQAKKNLALANKESLVMAGPKIMRLIKKNGLKLIPIDSEHTAIFQILKMTGKKINDIQKIILPCSGGPFFGKTQAELKKVTLADALNHPTWKNMGPKITIDSATMMNKAFEIIEAVYLYNLKPEQIEVIIHPEGKLHAVVGFKNEYCGLISSNDMKEAIRFCLGLANEAQLISGKNKAEIFNKLTDLNFIRANKRKLPGLKIGYKLAKADFSVVSRLCQLNTAIVEAFLNQKIPFTQITDDLLSVLNANN